MSGFSPRLSARLALFNADTTMASRITSMAASGVASFEFSSIMRVSRSWSRLPQFTPMRTGLENLHGGFDHFRELRVAFAAAADVAGIDAQFSKRLSAGRMRFQQLVAVEVKIAHQRRAEA